MYYLLLSGFIPEHKQSEFEQTCLLVSSQIPQTCSGYSFHRDEKNPYKYRFISYWPDGEEVEKYMKSPGYIMLSGAFSTLGELIEQANGKLVYSVSKNLLNEDTLWPDPKL
ncbi:MAG TPA: antibiotic biosynthesis monooxygenase [Puia sp.]|nr:antibiotic biosynthesis monooxygenase [Puia sp.]